MPKSDTAADGVIGIAMKCCIQRHPTHPDKRPLKPPKLNITISVSSSFGGLRGLLLRCAVYLWMQLFMTVPMTPSAAVSDFGGWRYLRFAERTDRCCQYSLSRMKNLSAVSLTPANNLSAVSLTPTIAFFPQCR